MFQYLLPAIRASVVLALLTGLAFPFAITVISQFFFTAKANGSLICNDAGQIVGSHLIAQNFVSDRYFHPRPSAVNYSGYNSSGSQLGPTSYKLIMGDQKGFLGVSELAKRYRHENRLGLQEKVPVDAVTRSGSGLDPDISVQNAVYQARRVYSSRGVPQQAVLDLIYKNTEPRQFDLLGEPRVNVLELNLKLDREIRS